MFPTSEIRCTLCGQNKTDNKKTEKGYQPDKCPNCGNTLSEEFDTLYFNGHLRSQNVHRMIQSQGQATSLCAVSRIGHLAYDALVSLFQALSQTLQNKLKYLSIRRYLKSWFFGYFYGRKQN